MCMVGRIFKEGVLASLSGGLYFDQSLGHFIWVVHLLLWLFFFTLPVVITVLSPTSLVAWASYSCVVTLIVSCILYWTYHLHKEFDKIDPVVRNNKSYKLLEDTERITLTGHDSDLSLDVHQISASHDICSPVVDVEEQCRQLGLASLRIADFNVHTGVSCGNVNPITLHPHPETSTINARTDFNEFSRPEAAANSLILHSIRRSPTLNQSFTSPENALTPCDATLAISLSKTCLRVNSSLSEDKLGRNQAHIFQPHIHRTDKCQVLTPEVEATSKQSQGSSSTSKTVDESDDDAFREIFLRHVNQVASDFNVPRCSSSIRRGSSNSAPSICFLGTRSIYNRRKVRSEVLLRHPLDTPANSQRCLKELSTCLSPEEAFTTSYGCPEVETTPAPEATTSFGGCEIISKMGSDLFGVPLLCEDGVDVKAELKLQLGVNAVVSPSSQITVPAPSTSVYRVSCTNFGNFEEVVLLPSKAQPLSPVSSTQVNSKETSSVSNRSPSVSRRRRTHHAQTPFPPPNATLTVTSIPTCASRDVRKTGPEEHGTHHVAISPRSRLPYSRPFISRRRLLTFPPDLNSLDLAYFLPLTSDDGVGNAPGPVSTTVRMHNCSPRWEIPRKDANVSVVQEPIQPRRSKSLGSQPDPTFRSSQQSSPTASIDRMIRGISHGDCLPTSLSPPSLRSETADVTAVEGSDSVESRYQTSSDRGTDLTNQPEEVASTSHNSQPSVFPVVRFSSRGRARQRNVSRGDFQYRVRLFPFWRRRFLIDFNRLQLIALFDRKSTVLEYLMTLALTILVSVLGSLLLSCGAFHGFGLTCFCYVLAGCHYSLIKSVQPDPASPLHGFNRLIVYSRSSVFCCLCALFAVSVLLIGGDDGGRRDACPSNFYFVRRYEAHLSAWPSHYEGIVNSQSPTLTLYGLSLQPLWLLCLLKDASGYLLLSFPLIFLFGLVPQINTLLAYILEQVDVHVFGASGSANLTSAALSVVRSVVVIAICFGFCHAAVNKCNPQSFFLSLFWGLHLAMCFMMSRTPNNVNIFHLLWTRMVSDAPAPPLRTQLLSCISSPVSFISRHRLNRSCVSLLLRRCLMSLQSLFTAKTIARGTTVAKEDEGGVETPLSPACCVTETSRQCDQQTQSSVSPVEPGNTEKPLSSPGAPTTLQSQPRLTSPEFPGPSPRPSSPNSPLGDVSTAPQTVSAPGSSRVPGPNVPSPSSTPPLSNAMTSDLHDPLPDRIVSAMVVRIHNDLLVMLIWFILGSAVHLSTVFTVPALQPGLPRVLTWLTIVWGFILHYVWPQLRKPFPWLLFTRTVFARPPDGRLTAFEVAYYWCHWLERYLLVPAVTMASVTQALAPLLAKFGKVWTTIILLITTMKLLRNGFSGATKMFLVLFFAEVLFTCDFPGLSETLPVDYFFLSIIISKIEELWNKLSFVYIYTAPFQASWGSICHAVAQLASIPHFVSILGNCVFSTLISAPLEPFVGSVFFITSYVRPIRFWEATQRLNRIESTTTSLYSQLRGVSFEQVTANLNAIFYEHLARCLQQRLAGDIALGRWSGGNVQAGDIYILASEEQHFLLHIIEVGNGLVTFQTRGLEFAGTYCHEQESNCLTELHQTDRGFCCCTLRNLPASVLSPNASVRLRWLAWQFVESHYTIEGYRLIDHSAATSLQVIDFRKIVVALFIQCLLYFTAWLPNLSNRLATLSDELNKRFTGDDKVDLDPTFTKIFDEDFDETVSGLTRAAFVRVYAEWIRYCLARSTGNEDVSSADESDLMTLCYAISLLGRRCLSGVSGHLNNTLDTFLHYLHDVFKGDVQIASKDDWVFADLDLLKLVVTPAMRVALKLYQDHFTWNPLSTNLELYEAIWNTTRSVVICHETDPRWRSAVLNNAEKLFSFRKIDSGTTQQCFRFIMMNKQTLSFQVIKLNSECVRGFWAGQLREQIFLRNKNAERGSIQHAKHVLRNLINSSCDQPVGYPIYVSPLLTSFSESHHEYCRVACPNLSIPGAMRVLRCLGVGAMQRCRRWCLGSRGGDVELNRVQRPRRSLQRYSVKSCHPVQVNDRDLREVSSLSSNLLHTTGDSDLASWCVEVDPNAAHTSPGTSFASSLAVAGRHRAPFGINTLSTAVVHLTESAPGRVKITDPNQILNNCLFKLEWPSQGLLTKCLPQSACPLSILTGVEGILVHRWTPSNIDPRKRSFCHRNIALVAFPEGPITLEGHYVAIWEDLGLEFIPENAQ